MTRALVVMVTCEVGAAATGFFGGLGCCGAWVLVFDEGTLATWIGCVRGPCVTFGGFLLASEGAIPPLSVDCVLDVVSAVGPVAGDEVVVAVPAWCPECWAPGSVSVAICDCGSVEEAS